MSEIPEEAGEQQPGRPLADGGSASTRPASTREAGTADAARGDGDEETGGARQEMPPVPDFIREAARQAPDHFFGMVDPAWSGEDAPPEWAVLGQWRSDLQGEVVEWQDNEEYRPSPQAMEWPDPTDPVDAAVQLAATGYGPAEDVTRALADAEVAVFVAPGGAPLTAVAPDDETPVVPVFTAPEHLHAAGRLSFRSVKIPDLVDELPEGHRIYLNPSGAVSMMVEPAMLREAVVADGGHEDGWLGALDDLLPAPADEATAAPAPVAPAVDGSEAAAVAARGELL
jgi:hypothetical protein